MYGTVARMKFKPSMAQHFMQMMEQESQQRSIPGSVGVYVYQMDKDPNEFYMAVIFESKEAYVANANSPEQHQDFLQMMEYLASEPEWHDGEIVWQGS
jgi:quinol monooxygenase YgiN